MSREAIELPGVQLNYEVNGDGPPLVLVHGSAVDGHTWDEVVPELARDHRVIVYDRRGYGRSTHKPVRDHRVHAADLVAVLERVAAGRQPWLVGVLGGASHSQSRPSTRTSSVHWWSSRRPSTASGS